MNKEKYEEFHNRHIQLWRWCAETGEDKRKAPFWNDWGRVENLCFACEIHTTMESLKEKTDSYCIHFCPMDANLICGETNTENIGLYWEWEYAKDKEVKKGFAKQIRDLPWKSYEEIIGVENGEENSNIQPD